jgi:hypothetical protein
MSSNKEIQVDPSAEADTHVRADTQVQAGKRGCCSSKTKEAVVSNSRIQSDESETRDCCKSVAKADPDVKAEAPGSYVAPITKPATDVGGKGVRVGCCTKVAKGSESSPKDMDRCCSSVESSGHEADVKPKPKVNDCCAPKSDPDITKVDVHHDTFESLASQSLTDDCSSGKNQEIIRHHEVVPPCCEGIASNCCDGKHFESRLNATLD